MANLGDFFKTEDLEKFKKNDGNGNELQTQDAGDCTGNQDTDFFPSESLGSEKSIYGTYFEMAFHNMFITMQHVYKLVFGKDILEEAMEAKEKADASYKRSYGIDFGEEQYVWSPMFEAFRKALPEDKEKVNEMLSRHFPLLVPFNDYIRNDKYKKFANHTALDILQDLSQVLRTYRNFYSHYKIALTPRQIKTLESKHYLVQGGLKTAFLGAKREIKKRFSFDDKTMYCAEQYKVRGYGKNMVKEEIRSFRYQTERKNGEGKWTITVFGLVMFASLFLEKKYAKVFSDKVHCVRSEDEPVICEMLSVYRTRLTVPRLSVEKPTDALALDMLNELQRCPQELFEMLRPEQQKKFRIKAESQEEQQDVLMIRHSDRFAELVMKYIDSAKLFENIRFQVSLGKYFFKFYDKKCIDGNAEARVRSLCKNVNGFGRIMEIEDERKKRWEGLVREFEDVHKNTKDEKPYVTDHKAQYVFNGNRIGMYIGEGTDSIYFPELTDDGAKELTPTCWMSIYEIPAMAFLMHLKGGRFVEEVIKDMVKNYRRLFSDIESGKFLPTEDRQSIIDTLNEQYGGIKLSDIPEKLLDAVMKKKSDNRAAFHEKTRKLIESLIEQTEYRLKRFRADKKQAGDAKMNKIGKKGYVTIKPGKLAGFLAKDMMFFQPDDSKLTGLNFRVLQSVLATFTDFNVLNDTLYSAHIIAKRNGEKCNPIMQEVYRKYPGPKDTVELYEKYLQKRLSYLKRCLELSSYKELAFTHPDRKKWQDCDEDYCSKQAGRYLHDEYGGTQFEKSLELPRGMFESLIREKLSEFDVLRELAGDASKNISYLIYAYIRNVCGDECQPFYEYDRCYPLFNTLWRRTPRDPKVFRNAEQVRNMLNRGGGKHIKAEIDRCLKNRPEDGEKLNGQLSGMKNTETTLKMYKVQDMVMSLLAKEILGCGQITGGNTLQSDAINSIKLKNILDSDTLSQKIRVKVNLKLSPKLTKTIVQDDLKLKDYAKFYRILNDRRLMSLLALINEGEVERSKIEEELKNYDKLHPGILEEIFNFEKNNQFEVDGKPVLNFREIIKNSGLFDDEQVQMLSAIRNAFAHQIYPKRYVVQEAVDIELPKKAGKVSDKFKENIKNRQGSEDTDH